MRTSPETPNAKEEQEDPLENYATSVPASIKKKIEADAEREFSTAAHIGRRIIVQYYNSLKGIS